MIMPLEPRQQHKATNWETFNIPTPVDSQERWKQSPKRQPLSPSSLVNSPSPSLGMQGDAATCNARVVDRDVNTAQGDAANSGAYSIDCRHSPLLIPLQSYSTPNTSPPQPLDQRSSSNSSCSKMDDYDPIRPIHRSASDVDVRYGSPEITRQDEPAASQPSESYQHEEADNQATRQPGLFLPQDYHPVFGPPLVTGQVFHAPASFPPDPDIQMFDAPAYLPPNQMQMIHAPASYHPDRFQMVNAPFPPDRYEMIRQQPWRAQPVALYQSPPAALYQAPPAARTMTVQNQPAIFARNKQFSTHFQLLPTDDPVNFCGFLPSSWGWDGESVAHVIHDHRGDRLHNEIGRARRNYPYVWNEDQLDRSPNIYYAKWGGGYVKVDDDLIARCVCPADLLSYPCRWDELPGGCQMLRLCGQLIKYQGYRCPDHGYRDAAYEGSEPSLCRHLHWEVEPSCRFVVAGRECEIVTRKGFNCSVGHDVAWGRKIARQRFEYHVRGALVAGAVARVPPRSIVLPQIHHRRMPSGPERLPQGVN